MQQINKFRHTKGFIKTWEWVIRFRDMVSEEACRRMKILAFWEKHGLVATKDAYGVSKATLYRWQNKLKQAGGQAQALTKKSTAPKRKRKRVIADAVQQFIITTRKKERVGKEKLAHMMRDEGIADLSASTVGRILDDLKAQGKLHNPKTITINGKTGNLKEKRYKRSKKKLRSKDHDGSLVKADTIVRFTDGIKRYISTGIDTDSKFGFAYAYKNHSSKSSADFMKLFKQVAPLSLTHVQTDNGSEFQHHFELLLNQEGIVHFHSYPRCPKMQAEIERFNRTLSEAFIQKHKHLLAYDINEFNRQLIDWLLWYNTKRPHWSLDFLTPLRYICNQLPPQKSHFYWTSTSI